MVIFVNLKSHTFVGTNLSFEHVEMDIPRLY